jgi:hypothetical protein
MKIVDIADELFRELGEPTDLSIPAMSFWLRTNIGKLNNLINIELTIDDITKEFSTDLTEEQKVIFKKIYSIHYYDVKIRSVLGAASQDSIREVTSDGSRIRKFSKNDLSKTYISARREETEDLSQLINSYKSTKSAPIQVVGDDTVPEAQNPDTEYVRIKDNQ